MNLWPWRQDDGDTQMRDAFILLAPIALTVAAVFLWLFWGKLVRW